MNVWIVCEAQVSFVDQTNEHEWSRLRSKSSRPSSRDKKEKETKSLFGSKSHICAGGFVDRKSSTIWSLILLGEPAAFVWHGPAERHREWTQSRRSRADFVCRCLLCTQLPPSAVGLLHELKGKPEETCKRNVSASRVRADRSGVGGADRERWIPSPPPCSTSG